jgi:glycerophosphoryl diester phosphodiesterase
MPPLPCRAALANVLAALACALALPAAAFELQGHRGARALAPENTIAGFARALAEGVDVLELDLFMSADGVLLVHHDPAPHGDIARDAQGAWLLAPGPLLRTQTAAQARAWDVGRLRPGSALARDFPAQQPHDGARIPTLDEVFAWVQAHGDERVRFNIELKRHPLRAHETGSPEALAQAVLAAVDRAGLRGRVVVQGFDWAPLQVLRRLAPALPLSCLSTQQRLNAEPEGLWTAGLRLAAHGGSVPHLVQAAGCRIWSPNFRDLDAAAVRQAQALGLKVLPWTVNERADLDAVIALGVDGVITDHPVRARAAMAAAGLPLPPRRPAAGVPAVSPSPPATARAAAAAPAGAASATPAVPAAGR